MTPRQKTSLVGIGLFAGAAAWAFHQQASYLVASWACTRSLVGVSFMGLLAVIILIVGAILSVWGLRNVSAGRPSPQLARPRHFTAVVALMASGLFLFTILMQSVAALFLPGCIG